MSETNPDIGALVQALEALNRTTQAWEGAYRGLQEQVLRLDQELSEKNRVLALTTDYLDRLLEGVSDGVIAVDREGVITRFNRAASVILGYTRDETVGRPFDTLFKRAFAAPTLPGQMLLQAKSGREVPVLERDSRVQDDAGNQLGQVKTFQDLSELTALREQVRLLDRLAAIGEMAATVAHEIRNPLGGIRGFASFLAQDIPEDDPKRRWVDKILTGTASLERIVTELLEYTRPVELSLRPARCTDIVANALAYLEYDSARIEITQHIPESLHVLADPGMMRQVFLNILLNAVQSISGPGSVTVAARDCGNQVELAVRDTGCGMRPEHLEKIWSPFFTTKEKGAGLGMAICQKIVTGHAGSLDAESEPGKGTTIRIHLPKAE